MTISALDDIKQNLEYTKRRLEQAIEDETELHKRAHNATTTVAELNRYIAEYEAIIAKISA